MHGRTLWLALALALALAVLLADQGASEGPAGALQPHLDSAPAMAFCHTDPHPGEPSPLLFWMPPVSGADPALAEEDAVSEDSSAIFYAYRDHQLRTTGAFRVRCALPLRGAQEYLTVLVGPLRPRLQSPLQDRTRHYFMNFTYSYLVLHPDVAPPGEPRCEDQNAGVLQLLLFARQRSSAGGAPPVFERLATVRLEERASRVPRPVAREEALHGIPSGQRRRMKWPLGVGRSSAPTPPTYHPHPTAAATSVMGKLWFYVYHYAVQHVIVDGLSRYAWRGHTRRLWQIKDVAVHFVVREWRVPPQGKMAAGSAFQAGADRSEASLPQTSDVLQEGRERVLHIFSYPPVARRSTMGHDDDAEAEEDFVCDALAIRGARHHFLKDPIVFVNQRAAGASPQGGRGRGRGAADPLLDSNDDEESARHLGSDEDFFADLLGVEPDEAASDGHRGATAFSASRPGRGGAGSKPYGATSALGSLLVGGLLFPPRLASALLWGANPEEAADQLGPFMALFLPSRGLFGAGGGVFTGSSGQGGFSLSASQLAARRFTEGVAVELGPLAGSQRHPAKTGASSFTSVRHELPVTLENAAEGEDPARVARFVYEWTASLPATRAVCVSLAPTEAVKHRLGTDALTLEYRETLRLDVHVLVIVGLFLLLGAVQRPLLEHHSGVLQAALAGVCGVLFLIGVGAYYLVKRMPRPHLGRASLYVLVMLGGIAACADALWYAVEHMMLALDAAYGVEWRFVASIIIGIAGFLSSLLLQRCLPQGVLASLTGGSYRMVRLLLVARALWVHTEAAVATLVLFYATRAAINTALFLLWIQYDPLLEQERLEAQREAAGGLPGDGTGPRAPLPSAHPPRRRPIGLWDNIQYRFACRHETMRRYTLCRVVLRFLRRLSRRLLFQLRRSIADLDSDTDSEDGERLHRIAGRGSEGGASSGRSSFGSHHTYHRSGSGSESPSPRASGSGPGRPSAGRRGSSLFRGALAVPTALVQRVAEELERRKHPHRYRRPPRDSLLRRAVRRWRRQPPAAQHSTGPHLEPLDAVLRKASRRSGRRSAGPWWQHFSEDESFSSGSSDTSDQEGPLDPGGFSRRPSATADAYFRHHINDPLDVFPASAYREAPPLQKMHSSRATDDAESAAFTKAQLAALARSIRRRSDANDLIPRLQRPQARLDDTHRRADGVHFHVLLLSPLITLSITLFLIGALISLRYHTETVHHVIDRALGLCVGLPGIKGSHRAVRKLIIQKRIVSQRLRSTGRVHTMAERISMSLQLSDQIGLNVYLPGTSRDDRHGEFLPYMRMGKDLHWLAAAERDTTAEMRQRRVEMRRQPENLVQACMTNNLPFVVMHWAAQSRIAEINEPVLAMGAVATPLMWAARQGHLGIVRFLLDHGADPSVVCGEEKSTALHWAISGGCPNVVRLLLDDDRTDPNQRNSINLDAAGAAASYGNALLLWMICEDEHLEQEKLREQGLQESGEIPKRNYYRMDPSACNSMGHNLLHYCAWRDCLAGCQYLIERWNFDVDAVDQQGRTPLIWASREGHTNVVEYLIRAGADVFHQDLDGMTALRYAATRAHPETARTLSHMLGTAPRHTGGVLPGRVVPLSPSYLPCRERRAAGTISALRFDRVFRAVFLSGFVHLCLMALLLLVLPPALSYMAAGMYIFRNYIWLYWHRIPVHEDGSKTPGIGGAMGSTMYCAVRGTWITRYRNPANLVLLLGVLWMQCSLWNKMGFPAVFPSLTLSTAAGDGFLVQEGAPGPAPRRAAAAAAPLRFFGGSVVGVFFTDAASMMSRVLSTLLVAILLLIVICKMRSMTNVIPAVRESHWTRSPMWRMLKSRTFSFFHPRVFSVERHLQIPVRAFHCSELDVHMERYDNFASVIDAPIASSNKLAWVLLLTLLAVQQLFILIWSAQLMQETMRCTWDDRQWLSNRGVKISWAGTQSPSSTFTSSTTVASPAVGVVNLVLNIGVHALPCRQMPYLDSVLKNHPRSFLARLLLWYLPSWSSFAGVFLLHVSFVGFIWAGLLALRQWRSVWIGASTMEMANPVGPREDGQLVSIFVPPAAMRQSIVCGSYNKDEEAYYAAVAPSKVRHIPPPNATHCIFASSRSGLANLLLFLVGMDGKRWWSAKTISHANTPSPGAMLAEVPLPSWDGLLHGTASSTTPSESQPASSSEVPPLKSIKKKKKTIFIPLNNGGAPKAMSPVVHAVSHISVPLIYLIFCSVALCCDDHLLWAALTCFHPTRSLFPTPFSFAPLLPLFCPSFAPLFSHFYQKIRKTDPKVAPASVSQRWWQSSVCSYFIQYASHTPVNSVHRSPPSAMSCSSGSEGSETHSSAAPATTSVSGGRAPPEAFTAVTDELELYGATPEQVSSRLFSEVSKGVNYFVGGEGHTQSPAAAHASGERSHPRTRNKGGAGPSAGAGVALEGRAEGAATEARAPQPCRERETVLAPTDRHASRPVLLDELDADLMDIIRRYYQEKGRRPAGASGTAPDAISISSFSSSSPSQPPHRGTEPMSQCSSGAPQAPQHPRSSPGADPTSTRRTHAGVPAAPPGSSAGRSGAVLPPQLGHSRSSSQSMSVGLLRSAVATLSSHRTLAGFPTHSSTSFVRAYISETNLSLQPAVIVSGLAALMNIVAFYFLQHHVLDTRDHLGLFLIGSYMVFSSYYMIYYFLERFSASFRRIHSHDKKFYIIGNLLKAGVLISITPFAVFHLTKIILFDEWQGETLQNLGCIYAIPDFISMIIVKRMRWSTWVHHLCVVLFNYFSILNDYQNENVLRCVVVYASFSSFAYCVNVLLASRFLGMTPTAARFLSFVALLVYAGCCAINWCWQVYYLHRLLSKGLRHWSVYVYMVLICLVMYDDMILNKWLLRYAQNTAFAASQMKRQQRQRSQ
eukprot:gene8578-6018_t